MFGKSKGKPAENERASAPAQQPQCSAAAGAAETQESPDTISCIGAGMTIAGKITGDGVIRIFGRVEGEIKASTVLIADGAEVVGDVVAQELTIGGRVKGTIHANRVTLDSTAVVEGDIFHRSLAIEENARFEGSSRREDNVADTPSSAHLGRPQFRVPEWVGDANRKLNGAPEQTVQASSATE